MELTHTEENRSTDLQFPRREDLRGEDVQRFIHA